MLLLVVLCLKVFRDITCFNQLLPHFRLLIVELCLFGFEFLSFLPYFLLHQIRGVFNEIDGLLIEVLVKDREEVACIFIDNLELFLASC